MAVTDAPAVPDRSTGVRPDGTPITWCQLQSPIGRLLVVAGPAGLIRIGFADDDHAALLAEVLAGGVCGDDAAAGSGAAGRAAAGNLALAVTQLDEYFVGARTSFDVPVDLGEQPRFSAAVLTELAAIPHGQVRSYAEVAERVGNPAAVRAVGGACGRNPVPIVVPCHRVLRSDGSLGGFGGGLAVKELLLRHEGHPLTAG